MYLTELFSDEGGMTVSDHLKQAALDLLIPLAGQKVEFATVGQVIDALRQRRPGIVIDRAMVMDLLNPNKVKLVKKIEGDRIYLQLPSAESRGLAVDDAEKEKEQVQSKAIQQAMKQTKEAT